jgi:guanosine-3',5'-bis(diphosphate) 3'-pyrophosphohydrolase
MAKREERSGQVVYRFERIPGVATADVFGGLEREIHVNLDAERIKALGLAPGSEVDPKDMEKLYDGFFEDRDKRLMARVREESRRHSLLADIALGNRMPGQVALALAQREVGPDDFDDIDDAVQRRGERILITGNERGVISFANCCLPIPGDEIMGYHTTGKGIVVHRLDCPNVAEYRKSPERWVAIGWDREVTGEYGVALRIEAENRPGVLAQIAAAIAQAESNIEGVEYLERDSNVAVSRFSIQVRDREHLADVIRKTRRLGVVYGVQRL